MAKGLFQPLVKACKTFPRNEPDGLFPLIAQSIAGGKEEGDEVGNMIRMKMGEKNAVYLRQGEAGFQQAIDGSRAQVKEDVFPTGL